MQQAHIQFSVVNGTGLICLNRPEALNALTTDMVTALRDQILAWHDDPNISHIIISASSPRAFSAGGDVRQAYAHIKAQDKDALAHFFRVEYLAALSVYECAKPVIALADGLVMGGGAGLTQCCSHVVMSEATGFAMPEGAIGLFPDAGASIFLGRCPRAVALYLGLTGRKIGAADCLMLGLAHSVTRSDDMSGLKEALIGCGSDQIEKVLARFQHDPGSAYLPGIRPLLEQIFVGDNIAAMLERAADLALLRPGTIAEDIHQALQKNCPMTMCVFLRLVQMYDELGGIPDALELDFRLALGMAWHPDFAEGVRAVLVDKSNDAAWQPPSAENITATMVDTLFQQSSLPPLR